MKQYLYLFGGVIVIAAVFLLTFSQTGEEHMVYSVQELKNKVENDNELIVLDVRTPGEYTGELGHVEPSMLIPVQELQHRVNELEKYRDREIAVICRTDNRSRAAASLLKEAGFENVVFVRGGMVEWNKQFGHPQQK